MTLHEPAASPVPPSAPTIDLPVVQGADGRLHEHRCEQGLSDPGYVCKARGYCRCACGAINRRQTVANGVWEDAPPAPSAVQEEAPSVCTASLGTYRCVLPAGHPEEWHRTKYGADWRLPAAAPVEGAITTDPDWDGMIAAVYASDSRSEGDEKAATLLSAIRRDREQIAEAALLREIALRAENARLLNELDSQVETLTNAAEKIVRPLELEVESLRRELAGYREVVERAKAVRGSSVMREGNRAVSNESLDALFAALASLSPTTGDT
jgi:hypothetical protein